MHEIKKPCSATGFKIRSVDGRRNWTTSTCHNNRDDIFSIGLLFLCFIYSAVSNLQVCLTDSLQSWIWLKEKLLRLSAFDLPCFVFFFQAASLPMSIIIVGVGPAEFDGKQCEVSVGLISTQSLCSSSYLTSHMVHPLLQHSLPMQKYSHPQKAFFFTFSHIGTTVYNVYYYNLFTIMMHDHIFSPTQSVFLSHF